MSEGRRKACILLASLEEDEAREVMRYLTEEERIKIKEEASLMKDEKTDVILTLVGENYGY